MIKVIRSINNIKSSNQTIDLYLKNVIKDLLKNKNKLIISKKKIYFLKSRTTIKNPRFYDQIIK